MSAQDESGVYYTPSLGFSDHHPNNRDIRQHSGYSQDALKQCSVKGCTDTLSSNDTNKMCSGCRSRHRTYASTKRAKRKLEKAAIGTAAARSEKDAEDLSFIDHTPQSITWVTAQGLRPSTSSTLSSLSTWNHAIDPCLFSGDVSPASPHHISPLMPHQTSTSSELANALTPRQPSTPVSVPASAVFLTQTTTDYNKHYHERATKQQNLHLQILHTRDDNDSNDNDEEQQAVASLQFTAVRDQDMEVSSSDRQTSLETAERSQGRSSDEVEESARFCTVKGCKAVISASYEYKMCPPCRTRYRTYGNTKRAKWKAERDAFDREMTSLRTVEDERRKAKGLGPLAESPEELRAWELSIFGKEVPVVPVDTLMNPSVVLAGVYPPSPSTPDSSHTVSPYSQLNKNPLLAAAANTSLPARMCTVSHCHKILPGYYKYKRCEQHRLQNRHHSQLKRVREKEVKAVEPEDVGIEAGERTDKDKETIQATLAPTKGGKEAGKVRSHDQRRSKFSCSAGKCQNLLLPSVRWRLCEPCRSVERRCKNQAKSEQKAAAEKDNWSNMNIDSQVVAIFENEDAAESGDGEAQESQDINHAISAGTVDPDAEGDIDMGENEDETEPKVVENQQPVVSPMGPPSMPPASMTGGFSRFHVTIDPRNASSSSPLDPTTSTAKLVTLDDPLAFRAYQPKTTPSAIGRILARNPGLSVDAFTEVLQAEGANTGVMTLNEASALSATKSIITPTIPTSEPFVYKAPDKKNASIKATAGKAKRKAASSEKQPTSSTTQAAPAPTPAPISTSGLSDSTASAPPGSYGSYGYPQYPYPYPYYIPSPYGMPPYPYPQAPPPIPSETKQKTSSKSSTSTAASSPSAQVPASAAIPGYPYTYPYPPAPYGYLPPNGYPYMQPRYVPGQQPHNGLPSGPTGTNPYPYLYCPPPAPAPAQVPTSTTPFPKTAAAARERQRTQDTKFNYYHYGAGSSGSPTTPNDKRKRKRRKVDPDYLEKFKAQTEAISISLAMDQARRGALCSVPTVPLASVASGNSNVVPPLISTQPAAVDARAPSKPNTPTRLCANKTCHQLLPTDTANTLCDKCRLWFKKHQAKAKRRFKLEPRKSLIVGKAKSEKKSKDSVELD